MHNISPVNRESKRLHDLGFAVLWLEPKSKKPIGSGWTSGPRKSWDALSQEYHPGMNVGVRLGTPSKIGDRGYLAVIDVDIKSTDARHKKEAAQALSEVIGDKQFFEVNSGRGNGSKHLYYLTRKPFKTWNPKASEEIVKVLIPSKDKISKREREELTTKELAQGWRLSRAWEISYYSDGRQVVLPPSIHPDTSKAYNWKKVLANSDELNVYTLGYNEMEDRPATVSEEKAVVQDLTIDAGLDIRWVPGVANAIRKLIIEGIWRDEQVSDRSAYLMVAAKGLLSAGLNRHEVVTVLTDRSTFLGECAYEHAQTTSRARAAKWLWDYTVKRVMHERDAALAFRDQAVVSEQITGEDAVERQAQELGVKSPSECGFYSKGQKGALVPLYAALLEQFNEDYPYKSLADMKTVYVFNGTHYEVMLQPEIKGYAEMCFSPKPEEKIRNEFLNKVLANNQTRRKFFFETTEGKFNFQNGIFNIETGEIFEHSPKFGFRGVLPFAYDPDAKCPEFKAWLKDIMLGDAALIRILQEFMGYVIRGGDYKYHKALWLSGKGRNGKSTLLDIFKALIGVENYSTISVKALVGDRFATAELDGKIANISEETGPEELVDTGPFKNLTGDGETSVQKKFGDPYTFRNRAKLIMSFNEIPDLKDLTPGMVSRPIVIPFLRDLEANEIDRETKPRLLGELPGIFNFALEGWKRLENQGDFTESAAATQALTQIKMESCSVYQWVEHCVRFSENQEHLTKIGDLYGFYRSFQKFPYSVVNFSKRLVNHPEMKKRRSRTGKERGYWGIVLDG